MARASLIKAFYFVFKTGFLGVALALSELGLQTQDRLPLLGLMAYAAITTTWHKFKDS